MLMPFVLELLAYVTKTDESDLFLCSALASVGSEANP